MGIVCHNLLLMYFLKGHARTGSTVTGIQLATRGRRDMSSRVRDVVLSLALCHNVRKNHSLTHSDH